MNRQGIAQTQTYLTNGCFIRLERELIILDFGCEMIKKIGS